MKNPVYSIGIAAAAVVFLLVFSSCYEPRIGCLDPNATNFDVSADKDTGRCVYPLIVFNLSHLYDDGGLNTDSFYFNSLGQRYRIKEFAYYLSGFKVLSGLQEYTIEDTLNAFKRISPTANDSIPITLTSDFGLVRRSTVELKVGTFREVGSFDGIGLDFGLRDEALNVLPGSVRAGSVLRPQTEMLYDSTNFRYHFGRFVIERISPTSQDTVTETVLLTTDAFAAGGNSINVLTPLVQTNGYDFNIKMRVDYKKWFDQVDWTQDMTTIRVKIAQELLFAFEFGQ